MRRFIAYLSLAVAGLATIGATYNSAFVKTETNIEYSDGRALAFRLKPEEKDDTIAEGTADEVAKMMQQRLETYGETKYDIVKEGDDTIKVILSERQDKHYNEITTYLGFNGQFAIGTKSNVVATGNEFLDLDKDCYVTYLNHYPTVVIPINKNSEELKGVIAEAETLQKEAEDSAQPDPETGEKPATNTFVYLAYNYVEGKDTISSLVEGSEDYDEEKASKKFMLQFDIANIWLNDEKEAIATSVNIADENGQVSPELIESATHTAKHTVNLLNADPLPCDVEFIYSKNVPAYFENVIALGMRETTAWSRTLIATLFAILIISLLLAVFYRWAAVAVGSLSIASVYLGLLLMIAFSVEFNTAAIIGLCAVALVSLASGNIYITKVKEECYRGRTLKKANAEGAKRALLPIVDINVVLVIIGACMYWLGGATMASFAAVTVFGGLVSLILNTLFLKGMMWLLTNTTKFQGNYTIIGVENNKVPNILNEEKQEYFGPYQNSNPTKHKKVASIIAGILFVASLVGTITFGAVNNGVIFNSNEGVPVATYLYVETTTENSLVNKAYLEEILDRSELVTLDNDPSKNTYANFEYEIETFENVTTEDKVAVKTTYLVVKLQNTLKEDALVNIYDNADDKAAHANAVEQEALETVFDTYLTTLNVDSAVSASFKIANKVSPQQPNYAMIIAAVAVGTAFAVLYLVLRYGLSRGIVTLLMATTVGFITAGIFTLTRAVVGLDLFIALPLIFIFTLSLAVMFMNKEKELILEDSIKNKDNSNEHRGEIMLRTSSLSLGPVLTITAIGIYLMTNFFGFGAAATSNIYMFALVGIIIAAVLIAILFGPSCHAVYCLFRKLNIKKPNIKKPRKKKAKTVKAKSAEPEEAIFIGIND